MAALPHVMTIILILTGGLLADNLYSRGYPLILIRRSLNAAGSFGPAIACFCFYLISCNVVGAVIIMSFIQTLMGLQHPSSKVKNLKFEEI